MMDKGSTLSQSGEYLSFRSNIPQKSIVVDTTHSSQGWRIYDCGPKTVQSPLVCIPPASGTADIFYNQCMSLSAKGVRVISVQAPPYWTVKDWCEGFKKLLDTLQIYSVHLFGASLGGYLAQKFAEYTSHERTVASIILCNSFPDTSIFKSYDSARLLWLIPGLILRRMVMSNFCSGSTDEAIADAIDFMVERIESVPQSELASRLTLNCAKGYVQPTKLSDLPMTIIDVYDDYALSSTVREDLYKCYPNAKQANLKSGGNFPYLSRCSEVNLHLLIHLRQFNDSTDAASVQQL